MEPWDQVLSPESRLHEGDCMDCMNIQATVARHAMRTSLRSQLPCRIVGPVDGEPVPWLTASEERVWRLFAAVLILLPNEMEAQLQRDAGVTLFGYGILSTLSEAPGRAM